MDVRDVTNAVIKSTGSEAAVIEGFNAIHRKNSTLTGGIEKTGGTMIDQSFSGDAETDTGIFTMESSSYEPTAGPAFFVTNTDSVITLNNVQIVGAPAVLIKATATSG